MSFVDIITEPLNIPGAHQVESERDKVIRRAMSLLDAVAEYDECVKDFVRDSKAREQSIPLSKKHQSELVGLSRSQFYRSGLNGCSNYYELFKKVKEKRPDLLWDLENNFENMKTYLKRR